MSLCLADPLLLLLPLGDKSQPRLIGNYAQDLAADLRVGLLYELPEVAGFTAEALAGSRCEDILMEVTPIQADLLTGCLFRIILI